MYAHDELREILRVFLPPAASPPMPSILLLYIMSHIIGESDAQEGKG